jgi:hypothetical protein
MLQPIGHQFVTQRRRVVAQGEENAIGITTSRNRGVNQRRGRSRPVMILSRLAAIPTGARTDQSGTLCRWVVRIAATSPGYGGTAVYR